VIAQILQKLRKKFVPRKTQREFERRVKAAVREFVSIQEKDFHLFVKKSLERGTEFEADGLVGCYLAIREIFVRFHFLLWKPFVENADQMSLSANDKVVLHNLLQDLRVTSALGQIDLASGNLLGSKGFLGNVLPEIIRQF
jgi:hypothetical protein